MTFKTIFIVIVSVMVTVVLMNNTDEIDFWIFGDARVPKLGILGSMFGLGLLMGFVMGRPRKKVNSPNHSELPLDEPYREKLQEDTLSEEDRDYIR